MKIMPVLTSLKNNKKKQEKQIIYKNKNKEQEQKNKRTKLFIYLFFKLEDYEEIII
jgi:hypothetical protein